MQHIKKLYKCIMLTIDNSYTCIYLGPFIQGGRNDAGCFDQKKASITRKCRNHTLQTCLRHREEEAHKAQSDMTPRKQL